MAAQQTVMGTESVWPDTATASLDSWVPTVPKVGSISQPIRPQLWFLLCLLASNSVGKKCVKGVITCLFVVRLS